MTTYNSIAGLNRALARLPKEASAHIRDASKAIAEHVADKAAGRARDMGGPAGLVADSIKATRDRVPVVKMGGAKRIRPGSPTQTIGNLIWGAEFGGRARPRTQQFLPHKGTTGYFLWPTVRGDRDYIMERYSGALLDALNETK
jgi:hypothetical protein